MLEEEVIKFDKNGRILGPTFSAFGFNEGDNLKARDAIVRYRAETERQVEGMWRSWYQKHPEYANAPGRPELSASSSSPGDFISSDSPFRNVAHRWQVLNSMSHLIIRL